MTTNSWGSPSSCVLDRMTLPPWLTGLGVSTGPKPSHSLSDVLGEGKKTKDRLEKKNEQVWLLWRE